MTADSEAAIVLNGRAAKRSVITGVERWAIEMTRRLPALGDRYVVAAPPAAFAHRVGQAWEQAWLPLRAARAHAALVFSPANIAPLGWPRNVVVLHDAAVLRHPEAYGRAYRLWHAHVGLAAARGALRVITVSEFSRRELIELAGIDADSIVVIPGGVDERFAPSAEDQRVRDAYGLTRPYVLTVATSDARKNLGLLAHVATRLLELGIDLVWAGGDRAHLLAGSGSDRITRLGYVPERDLPALYAGAVAFVLPSRYEGFGLTCIEAMAAGTPVVAADRAALPETCAGAALLVDPDDPEAVASAVIRAVTDTDLGARLRASGQRRAAALTWDSTARSVDALLSGLAATVA